MKLITGIAVLALALGLSACSDPEKATKVLEDAGYTDIKITGYRFTGCSDDDNIHTGFEAKSLTGNDVTGTVCGQWAPFFPKGSTIRVD